MRRAALVLVFALVGLGLASAADGAALKVATLSSGMPPTQSANFQWIASSPGTVVAAGFASDVFTESGDGWRSGGPAAVLSDPSVSGSSATGAAFASGLSMSGQTIVEGLTGAKEPFFEDVFVRPQGGWSGTVGPAARLAAQAGQSLIGGVISGPTVAAYAVTLPGGVLGPRVVKSVDVFTEPPAGWSGSIVPVARLAVPTANNEGGLAISGRTIYVESGRYVYVFVEPASGWSGTVSPSARLTGSGPISVSGRTVLAAGMVFSEPRSGWRGTVMPVAGLYPVTPTGIRGGGLATALAGDTAVMGFAQGGKYGCGCPGQVNVFTEPRGGWSGSELSLPAFYTGSATSILPVALQYPDLFVTGGVTVDVYQLSGRYGFRPRRPAVSHSRLSGLSSGRPGLRFTIATKPGYPTIGALTVRLPRGLAFTHDAARLASGVSIASQRPSLSLHRGDLIVGSLAPVSTLRIAIRPQALRESKGLKALIRRLARHGQHEMLDFKVRTVTTPDTDWTSILRLRAG